MSPPTQPKPGKMRQFRNAALVLVLVAYVLICVFSSSRSIGINIATSSSLKEKTAENKTEFHYNTTLTSFPPDEKDDTNMENTSADFYSTTWPSMQKALCGEGAPNLLLSSFLFHTARQEVYGDNDPRPFSNKTYKPSVTQMQFFAGESGASIFEGVNEKGENFSTIYVKIWKCGNNQIRWMERKLYKHLNGTYDMLQLPTALRKNLSSRPCIYTAVRDPISHFLSGYNEVEVRQLGEYNNKSADDWPVNSKPAPYHLSVPYSSESHELRKERFRKFVFDVLLEEPTFGSYKVYSHFFPMSRILVILKKFKKELTGYIPRLENITSTWPTFLSSTCENFPSIDVIPTMQMQGQHRSSKDRLGLYQAAKDVWNEGGPIARSLCILHAFDYACFEDLSKEIPEICRDVYQDYADDIIEYASENYFHYSHTADMNETTEDHNSQL